MTVLNLVQSHLLQDVGRYSPLLLLGSLAVYIIYLRHFHALHKVPGPYLASITQFYLLFVFLSGNQHWKYIELHQRYGPVVRVGPNVVLISDPKNIPEFAKWDKSDWWLAFRGHPHDIPHANELDAELHKIKKRRVMGGYSLSQVLKNERQMDGHIMEFINQLSRRCGTVFDIAPWTQFATFDVALEMAFSRPAGFIKTGTDVGGLIASLHELFAVAGAMALFPWTAKVLCHPWLFPLIGPKPTDKKGPGVMHGFAFQQVQARLAEKGAGTQRQDILQWIMDHEDRDGVRLTRGELEQEAIAPVLAGSDTTASTLRTIILYVSTNLRVQGKLLGEIDAADARGLLSTPPTFDQVRQHVPYLDAVLKEALRLVPAGGTPFYRAVPAAGASVDGFFLPARTEVGISHWAVGRSTAVHGADATLFRPERWTDDIADVDDAGRNEKRRLRDLSEVWFGAGNMMCTGRNVAQLEMYRMATQFFRSFAVEIVDPCRPWEEIGSLAMIHRDFLVKLTERTKHAPAPAPS